MPSLRFLMITGMQMITQIFVKYVHDISAYKYLQVHLEWSEVTRGYRDIVLITKERIKTFTLLSMMY
jgi:hypothetical protein